MTSLHLLVALVTLVGPEGPPGGAADAAHRGQDLARLREILYSRPPARPAPYENVPVSTDGDGRGRLGAFGPTPEQSQAALLLVQNPTEPAYEEVVKGLSRWERPDVFQALTAAIRLRRDRRFLFSLLNALQREPPPAVRLAAVETVARLADGDTLRNLAALAADPLKPVPARQAACAALGQSLQKAAVVHLLSLLSGDAPLVREAAGQALDELTGQGFGTDIRKWQDWWQYHKELTDQEWLTARAAFFADRVRRLRGDVQQAENHILLLQQTLYARLPPTDRPAHLKHLVENEYAEVRIQAIQWITETLGDTEGPERKLLIDKLLQLTEDSAEQVQQQAVLALDPAADPRIFERLLALLEGGADAVRAAAARSLGKAGPGQPGPLAQQAQQALKKALLDPSFQVVKAAAGSLGDLEAPEAAGELADLLHHPAEQVGEAAAKALEKVATPAVLDRVGTALADPHSTKTMRFNLVGAVGRTAKAGLPPAKQAELIKQLQVVLAKDSDAGVRSRAATVLGDLGTPAEVAALWQRVTALEDQEVQRKAWQAMVEILARAEDWAAVGAWERTLFEQRQLTRRTQLLADLLQRWQRQPGAKAHLDPLATLLVQAYLDQQKWQPAKALATDLVKRSANPKDLDARMRLVLRILRLALNDRRPRDVLQIYEEIKDRLPQVPELAAEVELQRKAAQSQVQ